MSNLFLRFNKGHHLPHIERKFLQTYDLLKKQSVPNHPKDRSGVCLVVGSHPCFTYDMKAAMEFFNEFDVCAINDMAGVLVCDYLATAHPEKIDQFIGNNIYNDIEIHSRSKMKRPDARDNEYVWNLNTGGGSGLFAVAVMLSIGYELVIMCGCPMDGGGGYAVKKHDGDIYDPRFGDLTPAHTLVQGWHGHLKRFKEQNSLSDRVRSMSGYTKKIFGGL